MTNADWWAREVQALTEHDDLRPKRVWALRKDGREPAIDVKAVPGAVPRSCSRSTGSCARRGCSAPTSRRNWVGANCAQTRTTFEAKGWGWM
jgi:hypothetical protein